MLDSSLKTQIRIFTGADNPDCFISDSVSYGRFSWRTKITNKKTKLRLLLSKTFVWRAFFGGTTKRRQDTPRTFTSAFFYSLAHTPVLSTTQI